jgi:hypothetical protein
MQIYCIPREIYFINRRIFKTDIFFNELNVFTESQLIYFVGFEVLTAVVVKSSIFWDIIPCSPLDVNQLHSIITKKIDSSLNSLNTEFLHHFL